MATALPATDRAPGEHQREPRAARGGADQRPDRGEGRGVDRGVRGRHGGERAGMMVVTASRGRDVLAVRRAPPGYGGAGARAPCRSDASTALRPARANVMSPRSRGVWCLHTTHGAVRPSQHQKVNLQVRGKATTLSLFVEATTAS